MFGRLLFKLSQVSLSFRSQLNDFPKGDNFAIAAIDPPVYLFINRSCLAVLNSHPGWLNWDFNSAPENSLNVLMGAARPPTEFSDFLFEYFWVFLHERSQQLICLLWCSTQFRLLNHYWVGSLSCCPISLPTTSEYCIDLYQVRSDLSGYKCREKFQFDRQQLTVCPS